MAIDRRTEPHFSQPVRQIVMMLIVVGVAVACAILLFPTISSIFQASIYLKIFIVVVFLFGVVVCFQQVVTLIASVSWIEGFALERPGQEFSKAPRLLAPLAALLSERAARRSLSSSSTRSILESVSIRIEEQRDLTRYIINLLIFLGLLGTFYGLATVVPAVVDTIRSLAPREGQTAIESFDALMRGLEGQLGGMGTAFGSSLLGLAGSLIVGLLELFVSHAQNRFYRELEDWLSSFTKLGVTGIDADEPLTAGSLLGVIEQTAMQIDGLREVMERSAVRAAATEAQIQELARLVASPERREAEHAMLSRLVEAQERVASLLEARDADSGRLDAETRARLRSIDTQVLRILEDMAAGRQDLVSEVRSDIAGLTEALRGLALRYRS